MLRNDYRRALIMLRSLRQGVSGYVRLERRTLMGSMSFTVNGAGQDEALYALLLYEQGGLWRACPLDRLGQPRYGQCGAVCRFDPRNICGRALEDYALVTVASVRETICELLLAGYLNGTVLTDWQQVKQAVCQALAVTRASSAPGEDASAHEPASAESAAPPIPAIAVQAESADPEGEQPTGEDADSKPMPEGEGEEAANSAVNPAEDERPALAEPRPTGPEPGQPLAQDELDQPAQPAPEETSAAEVLPDEFDKPAESVPEPPRTAGELLGIDLSLPWPTGIEPLRELFETLPPVKPFEAEGFTLIEAPLAVPDAARCVIGISAEGGKPARVLYAVPGRYALEPPSNMVGYEWRGGTGDGYWVTIRPVE